MVFNWINIAIKTKSRFKMNFIRCTLMANSILWQIQRRLKASIICMINILILKLWMTIVNLERKWNAIWFAKIITSFLGKFIKTLIFFMLILFSKFLIFIFRYFWWVFLMKTLILFPCFIIHYRCINIYCLLSYNPSIIYWSY